MYLLFNGRQVLCLKHHVFSTSRWTRMLSRGRTEGSIRVLGRKGREIGGTEVAAGREKCGKGLKWIVFDFRNSALPQLVGQGTCKGATGCLAQCRYSHGTAVHEMKTMADDVVLSIAHRNTHNRAGYKVNGRCVQLAAAVRIMTHDPDARYEAADKVRSVAGTRDAVACDHARSVDDTRQTFCSGTLNHFLSNPFAGTVPVVGSVQQLPQVCFAQSIIFVVATGHRNGGAVVQCLAATRGSQC